MQVQIKNVDDYIAAQPIEMREKLETLRFTIIKAAPKAEEKISYGMPGYKLNGMLAYFANFKSHYSLFITPKVLLEFKNELKNYKVSKGGFRIPQIEKVPVKLVRQLVKRAVEINIERAEEKKKKNESNSRNRKTAVKRTSGK